MYTGCKGCLLQNRECVNGVKYEPYSYHPIQSDCKNYKEMHMSIKCPVCGSFNIRKAGKQISNKDGVQQQYMCDDCLTATTNPIINNS